MRTFAVVRTAFMGLLLWAGVASAVVPGNWSASVPMLPNPNQYFVATNGTSGATGDMDHPWDITSALNGSHTIAAGSIIWIRGGTYVWANRAHVPGNYGFIVKLSGTSGAPVHVRAYPGERAAIDGGLDVGRNGICSYMWLWDLEMIVHEEGRTSAQSGSDPRDLPGPLGGLSLYEVQKLLGHSNIAVTQVYSHLQPEGLHGTVNRISHALN